MTNTAPAPAQTVPLTVLSQYVKDFSFENPNAPGVLAQLSAGPPQVNVNVTVGFRQFSQPSKPEQPVTYEGVVTIKADGTIKGQVGFVVECSYAGLFAMPQNVPPHIVRGIMMVEAPRLLFPFARQVCSDAVMHGGYGPLLIAPVDFMALHQQQQQGEQLAVSPAAGNA